MNADISPKYQMNLINAIHSALNREFPAYSELSFYIKKWHKTSDDWNNPWENFAIVRKDFGELDLLETLHNIDGHTLLQMAVDIGVETPDFIPSVATFRNEIKSSYSTASATFERAFKQIEEHPDIAIGLANSALESILKEIFKDKRIKTSPETGRTLYDLTKELLKEFQLYPNSDMPIEIRTIGSSLIAVNQNIEKIRSTKTSFHGKTSDDYSVNDSLYTYFVVNSVATIGIFIISFYKKKFPTLVQESDKSLIDDLPF